MKLIFSPLSMEQFLSEYWQQKPVIIKGGLVDFNNPLEADELAGLATESNIESRLIYRQKNGDWSAESGPFEDFSSYGDSDWSLVVQSVNHWIPDVQTFARLFDFIPQWRFDDVMVSFAAKGGGVGPHVDNYDVFICQGSGQRRWRVGNYGDFTEVVAHEKLLHVEPFTAVIDEILSAGDILYIPPGCPHEGVSLDSSMSFSVGYKATNSTELLSGFADYLIDFDNKSALLDDKQRDVSAYGQLDSADFSRLQKLLCDTLDDKAKLSDFFGVYLSQSRSELDLGQEEYRYDEWLNRFAMQPLQKLYAVKMLYMDETVNQGVFYVDGERQHLEIPTETDASAALLKQLCDCDQITLSAIGADHETVLRWLWQSTNRGYWYFI